METEPDGENEKGVRAGGAARRMREDAAEEAREILLADPTDGSFLLKLTSSGDAT